MTTTEFFNDIISVTAAIDASGEIKPGNFTWQGETYTIVATGRQWESGEGRHILVEASNGNRFEIQLSRQNLLWYLKKAWREDFVA